MRSNRSFFRISTVFAFLLLVHTLYFAWMSAVQYPAIDLFTFWSVSQSLAQKPGIPIYSLEGQREMASMAINRTATSAASDLQRQATGMVLRLYDSRIDAISSPLLYTAVGLFSSGDFPTDHRRFLFLSLLCLVSSALFLGDLLRFTMLEIFVLLSFLLWNYEPVSSDLTVGNVNSLQLFFVTLFIFLTARQKPLLAGLAIGTVTSFKPTTVMVIVVAIVIGLIDRDFKQLLRMLAGCVAAAVASIVISTAYFANPAIWLQFLRSLPQTLGGTYYSVEGGNVSLSALLFGPARGLSSAISLILLAALFWLLISSRRAAAPTQPPAASSSVSALRLHSAFAAGGCGSAIMLLSSPLVWEHYYLLLLPLSLYVMPTRDHDPSHESYAPHSAFPSLLLRILPFAPFVVFSLLFDRYLGKDHLRLLCLLIVLSAFSTLLLACHRLWHHRRTTLSPSQNPAAI